MSKEMTALREEIAKLDRELLELLKSRFQLAAKVGRIKAERGQPVVVPEVEERVLERAREAAELCVGKTGRGLRGLARWAVPLVFVAYVHYSLALPSLTLASLVAWLGYRVARVLADRVRRGAVDLEALAGDRDQRAERLLVDG